MTGYAESVAAWQEHLLAGGTTTWSDFLVEGRTASPQVPTPDATHLELVRRLNGLGAGHDLADLVLRTASPGRGAVDTPLAWPQERRYGTPAVEPERLPEEELIRLATGVLARLLPDLPATTPAPRSDRWPFPWRRRVLVHGPSGTAGVVRRLLVERGAVESGWKPVHVVVARPLEVMLAEQWAAATRVGAIVKWSTVWRRAASTGRLPGGSDVGGTLERLRAEGAERVVVVVARDLPDVVAQVSRSLGVRPTAVADTGELAQTDLLRRLNRLLAVTQGPARVRDLTARLLALPTPPTDRVQAPFVPAAARAWAQDTAASTASRIEAAGYPVHGELAALVPHPLEGAEVVDRSRVLELALHACLAARSPHQEGP